MKKVLIGAKLSRGVVPADKMDNGKAVYYDNINLYVADYDNYRPYDFSDYKPFDNTGKINEELKSVTIPVGFTYSPAGKDGKVKKNLILKIKVVDFKEIVGINPKRFLEKFIELYMFHRIVVTSSENDYGDKTIESIRISELDCRDEIEDYFEPKSVDTSNGKYVDLFSSDDEGQDSDGFTDLVDDFDFDLDKDTGEVKVTKRSGAGEIS